MRPGFLAQAVENEGTGYFDGFDNKINKVQNNRITLINKNGTVLFDSRADVSVNWIIMPTGMKLKRQ